MDHDRIDPFERFLNDFCLQQSFLKETLIHRTHVLQMAIKLIEVLEEDCPHLEASYSFQTLKTKLAYSQSLDFYLDIRMAALKELAQKAQEDWKDKYA